MSDSMRNTIILLVPPSHTVSKYIARQEIREQYLKGSQMYPRGQGSTPNEDVYLILRVSD